MLKYSYKHNTMQYNMSNFILFFKKIALNKDILS